MDRGSNGVSDECGVEGCQASGAVYLSAIAIDNSKLETATFAMHCYSTGEARLGSIDGVMSTSAGWAGGLEVVQLTYDPSIVEYSKLVETAQSFQCATKVFTHSDAQLKTAKALVGGRAVEFPLSLIHI